MSNDDGKFVERPKPKQGSGIAAALMETAANGKAIVGDPSNIAGVLYFMKRKGFRVRTTKNGAPEGKVFAWCERIETPQPQ